MAKSEPIKVESLIFDHNAVLTKKLRDYATNYRINSRSKNPFITFSLQQLPNIFSPRTTSYYHLSNNENNIIYSEAQLQARLGRPLKLSDKAELGRQEDLSIDYQKELNKYYNVFCDPGHCHKSVAEQFKEAIVSKYSFVSIGFRYGMVFEGDNSKLVPVLDRDLGGDSYVNPKKYLTAEQAKNWKSQSQVYKMVEYLEQLGFITQLMSDIAADAMHTKNGVTVIDPNYANYLTDLYAKLANPDNVVSKDFKDYLFNTDRYKEFIDGDPEGKYDILRSLADNIKTYDGKPLITSSDLEQITSRPRTNSPTK